MSTNWRPRRVEQELMGHLPYCVSHPAVPCIRKLPRLALLRREVCATRHWQERAGVSLLHALFDADAALFTLLTKPPA